MSCICLTVVLKQLAEADVIAIGVVLAVVEFGGPIIPYRGGRIDASAVGASGVSPPEEGLQTHTFGGTCSSLMDRTINAVPEGVSLTEVIQPLPAKAAGVENGGNGQIRLKIRR